MSKHRKLKLVKDATEDMQRRITAASREFNALLARHRVVPIVERGESSATGKFERIVFGVALPTPTDPVRPSA